MDPSPNQPKQGILEGKIRGGNHYYDRDTEKGEEHERSHMEEDATHLPTDRKYRTQTPIREDLLKESPHHHHHDMCLLIQTYILLIAFISMRRGNEN